MGIAFEDNGGKLGFGLMRLPMKPLGIDVSQTADMVDLFLGSGFNYFDTARVYPGSETAIRKALVERHPRDSYTMASKLNVLVAPTRGAAERQFETSLEKTGLGYLDYYLLHAIMENNYRRYEKLGLWDFVAGLKERGLVRFWGFSFHAGPDLLDRLLAEHPEVDFVQLQINYADWNSPSVASRANYEVACRHGKPVIVMEPVKGGKLADPPAAVKELFGGYAPDASYASWAIRFAASLENVAVVLSGMGDMAQMRDNLSYMSGFKPLDDAEQKIIREAQGLLGQVDTIACTACGYCLAGCPQQLAIPAMFEAANKQLGNGLSVQAAVAYGEVVSEGRRASDCIGCGKCAEACPQHLDIPRLMERVSGMFD